MRDLTSEPHIEVLSGADGVRRRHWSDADKVRIVEESFAGHRQVSATARPHDKSRDLFIDGVKRRIVGWWVSRSMQAEFVLDALEQALHERRPPDGSGLIHHSDRGSQQPMCR